MRPRSAPAAFDCADTAYHRWHTAEISVGERRIAVASKPGVPGFGELDPSVGLLLDHLEVSAGETVWDLHCGSGAVGALAALSAPGGRVRMADRNLLAVEAARRTLAANGVEGAEVAFGHGARGLDGPADIAVIRIPKGRSPLLQLLWEAYVGLRPGGRCYLAGPNDEGARTALRSMAALFGDAALLGYRGGCRIGLATRPEGPPAAEGEFDTPWTDPERFHRFKLHTRGGVYEVHSRPGVFSWDRLDHGSRALIEAMEVEDAGEILELGCGYGIVGMAAARLAPGARLTLVDVDADALRSARRSVEASGLAERIEVLASDGAAALEERRFDRVLVNPPFHVGKATDLEVPAQLIRDAARVLAPGGRLYLVANRTLPYEAWIRSCFGAVETVRDGREFKVLSATRQRRKR
jgi:16S rRNA (guanine1207-N2)-methyltransferase